MSDIDTHGSYFDWLTNSIRDDYSDADPDRSYILLMRTMNRIPFVSLVAGDENRRHDGTYMRMRYTDERDTTLPLHIRRRPCSMLEMLVALSERMYFLQAVEGIWDSPKDAFEELLANLMIDGLTDSTFVDSRSMSVVTEKIENACERINHQMYDRNGDGGLFPLQNPDPEYNAIDTEIWYQMQAYLIEKECVYEHC